MITCYGDSDHASDVETRRSTVGQVIMLGTHCVKHCCKLWSQIGLSSAESRKRDVYVLKKDLEQIDATEGCAIGVIYMVSALLRRILRV